MEISNSVSIFLISLLYIAIAGLAVMFLFTVIKSLRSLSQSQQQIAHTQAEILKVLKDRIEP